jgi:hypothetical protein
MLCMRACLAVAVFVVLPGFACASESTGSPIDGIWSEEGDVGNTFEFAGDSWKQYMRRYGIPTTGAPDAGGTQYVYAMQFSSGTFTRNGGVLNLVVARSSCVGIRELSKTGSLTFNIQYFRDGTVLTITGDPRWYVKTQSEPPGVAVAQMGCFLNDLDFTPHAVESVP